MRNFVEELITLNKEDLMQLPKEFLLMLLMNYSDCIKVHIEHTPCDELEVEITKVDLWCALKDSGAWDKFEVWMKAKGCEIDFSDC